MLEWTKIDESLPGELHSPKLNGDVGWDLAASTDTLIHPGAAVDVPINVAVALPHGYWGEIRARSSIARRGLQVDAGTLDNGYRGPLYALVRNMATPNFDVLQDSSAYADWKFEAGVVINAGERVAQLVLHPIMPAIGQQVSKIRTDTMRGTDGFGSTGV